MLKLVFKNIRCFFICLKTQGSTLGRKLKRKGVPCRLDNEIKNLAYPIKPKSCPSQSTRNAENEEVEKDAVLSMVISPI